MGYVEEKKKWPPWLKPLLKTKYFGQCKIHADSHKSECNMYCLDSMNGALCSFCLAYHPDHRVIQCSPAMESASGFTYTMGPAMALATSISSNPGPPFECQVLGLCLPLLSQDVLDSFRKLYIGYLKTRPDLWRLQSH